MTKTTYDHRYLQPSRSGPDKGEIVGIDPRKISISDLRDLPQLDGETLETSPIKAIRRKCLDCVYSDAEVRKCVQITCPLWPFRMGKNPFHSRSKNSKETPDD